MAKFPKSNSKPTNEQKSDRAPFLKPEHLTNATGNVSIAAPIRLYTGGKFGDQIIVHALVEQKDGSCGEYDWSLKIGGQAFVRLEKQLGKDLTHWTDGTIVRVQVATFNGKNYVEVCE